jgi:hypothetical protein
LTARSNYIKLSDRLPPNTTSPKKDWAIIQPWSVFLDRKGSGCLLMQSVSGFNKLMQAHRSIYPWVYVEFQESETVLVSQILNIDPPNLLENAMSLGQSEKVYIRALGQFKQEALSLIRLSRQEYENDFNLELRASADAYMAEAIACGQDNRDKSNN